MSSEDGVFNTQVDVEVLGEIEVCPFFGRIGQGRRRLFEVRFEITQTRERDEGIDAASAAHLVHLRGEAVALHALLIQNACELLCRLDVGLVRAEMPFIHRAATVTLHDEFEV